MVAPVVVVAWVVDGASVVVTAAVVVVVVLGAAPSVLPHAVARRARTNSESRGEDISRCSPVVRPTARRGNSDADYSSPVHDQTERLLAYEEIRQLVARYATATDAKDIDALVSLYVPDVRISSKRSGRAELHDLMTDALRLVGITFLNVGTHLIEISDDNSTATGVVYCKAEIQDGGPHSNRWIHQAIHYHDVYERREGRWYFASNRKHLLVYGADHGDNPLLLDGANWPDSQTGRGTHPQALASWQNFFDA